jgi:DNA-binding winged helix-turn-helix (wHTH) protein/TolB-like protein
MRFAEFEIDPDTGILRRDGVRIKLQDLPFRLLVALLKRPGALVTRDELRGELWGAETFVDAEAGLNTAIAKLRDALGDDAETPKFIETLPKRGYRFVGTLGVPDKPAPATDRITARDPSTPRRSKRRVLAAVAGAAVLVLGFAGYQAYLSATRVTIAVVRFHNETGLVDYDRLAGTLTDAVVVSLAQNARYGVIGNSPLLRTERIFEDVQRIGAALGADFVVLGQVQQGDAGLLVRGHFIRVSDQKHLWAGKIELAGATDLERRVTTAIADGIGIGLARR